jgi:putative nucleotidyltransferase with HDIG domain
VRTSEKPSGGTSGGPGGKREPSAGGASDPSGARGARRESTARIALLRGSRTAKLRRLLGRGPWWRALETPWIWVGLLLALGTWALAPGAPFARRVAPGSIATHDYVAPRDLLIYEETATAAKQEQARQKVLPVYDLDSAAIAQRDHQLEQLFAEGRRLAAGARSEADREAAGRQLASEEPPPGGVRIEPAVAALLGRKGFAPELEDRVRGMVGQALRRGVVENKGLLLDNRMTGVTLRDLSTLGERVQVNLFEQLGYPEEAREFLAEQVRPWGGLTAAERRELVDWLLPYLSPDLHLNRNETLLRQDSAAVAAGQVLTQIRQGQTIARKGDVIDADRARVLDQMRGRRQSRGELPAAAGTLLLLGLAALAVWLGLSQVKVADHSRRRIFGESVLLLVASLLGAKLAFLIGNALSSSFELPPFNSGQSYAYAVPFAALALLAMLLFGRYTAVVLAIVFTLLTSRLVIDADPAAMVLYGFAGSLAAIFALDRYQFRQRLVMPRVGMVVGAVNVLLVLILWAVSGAAERGLVQVLFHLVCALAGGLAAAALASFALPICESMLGITTDIKLVELSNTNLPLLRRLAFEAPGTFQHSLMVANLAKEGCEAIGADPVLAYTGALYHDIGKVFRAEYFIENQRPGENRHDKLLPSMSVLILINHVKEGLELARQHHLPRVLLDAIEQHHGTRLIRFFYSRALEQRAPGAGEVRQEKYRYPGPRPQNKVMGVLMLADGVEAASRTLVDATPAKIRALIRTIVDDCLSDGQLDQTDLTLSDLKAVGEAFLRVLATIFHQRVDYPGFDFNAGARRERRPPSGALKVS